jgi:hypothetical protein
VSNIYDDQNDEFDIDDDIDDGDDDNDDVDDSISNPPHITICVSLIAVEYLLIRSEK